MMKYAIGGKILITNPDEITSGEGVEVGSVGTITELFANGDMVTAIEADVHELPVVLTLLEFILLPECQQ